ncbi:MAG: cupredoxin domain-containing protein [Thermomicrobiales bacterium]
MGFRERPLALAVLGLMGIGLIGVIALQTVPPPIPPTTVPQAAPAATPTAAVAASTGGGASATVSATEKEYAIALDNSSVPAGSVTFKITNQGSLPHDISIKEMKKTSEMIDAGKTGQFTIDLPAGTYTVICDIPGHEQLGMHVTLTVK